MRSLVKCAQGKKLSLGSECLWLGFEQLVSCKNSNRSLPLTFGDTSRPDAPIYGKNIRSSGSQELEKVLL